MPRRKHAVSQVSLNNLKPGGLAHKLTDEDRAKGQQVLRERRTAQAAINRILSSKLTAKQSRQYELMGNKATGDETVIDLLMAGQARAAVDGSEKCARLILEYAGEKASRGESTDLLDLLDVIRKSAKRDDEDDTEP